MAKSDEQLEQELNQKLDQLEYIKDDSNYLHWHD